MINLKDIGIHFGIWLFDWNLSIRRFAGHLGFCIGPFYLQITW